MFTFIVGFDDGHVEEINANDMLWLTSELNQKGSRNNIAFIIAKGAEVMVSNYINRREDSIGNYRSKTL